MDMKAHEYVAEFSRILEMLESKNWRDDLNKGEVALGILHELAKDRRMETMNESRGDRRDPATEKQKRFMEDLGIVYGDEITKREASEEIEEALRNKRS